MARTSKSQVAAGMVDAIKTGRLVSISPRKLYAWVPKLKETRVDVAEGRLSYNAGKPLLVSQLDSPRGGYFIMDGHHRAVEAVLAGHATITAEVSQHVPRIERTGDAYRDVLADKANVVDFLKRA